MEKCLRKVGDVEKNFFCFADRRIYDGLFCV